MQRYVDRHRAAIAGSACSTSRRPRAGCRRWSARCFDRDGAVWAGGAGDAPGARDAQYRIGSITKTLTAVLVLQLRDDGLLDLDDRLGRPPRRASATATDPPRAAGPLLAACRPSRAGRGGSAPAAPTSLALAAANDGVGAASRARASSSTTPTSATGCSARSWPGCAARRGGRLVAERLLTPLGMPATTYLPAPRAQPGLVRRPLHRHPDPPSRCPTPAPWPRPGRCGARSPTSRLCGLLLDGHDDVLGAEALARDVTPAAGRAGRLRARARLPMFRGGSGTLVGHSGSMPGFHGHLPRRPRRGDRRRRAGQRHLRARRRGRRVPRSLGEPERVGAVAAGARGAQRDRCRTTSRTCSGLWYWGNAAVRLRVETRASTARGPRPRRQTCALRRRRRRARRRHAATTAASSSTSYARQRRPGPHLESRTFIFTRSPTTQRRRSPAATRVLTPS